MAAAAAAAVNGHDNGAGGTAGTAGSSATSETAVGGRVPSGLQALEDDPEHWKHFAADADADQPEGALAAAAEGGSGSAAGGRVLSGRLTRLRPHQLTEIPEDAPVAPPLALDEMQADGLAACTVNDGDDDVVAVNPMGSGREGSAGGSAAAAGAPAVALGAAACGGTAAAAAAAAVAGVMTAAKLETPPGPPVTHPHQHVGGVCLLDGMEQYNSIGMAEAAVVLPGSTAAGADLAAGAEVFDDVASVSSVSSVPAGTTWSRSLWMNLPCGA